MPVFIIWYHNGPHGGWATLEIWNILFPSLFSEVYQRTGRGSKAKKTNMFIVLFWEIVMILWVAFRVEDCCFVINLKWVEYTGPYIVHSHLLRIFALISTFFYTHLDEPYRILINYELLNLPSEVMFIIFFSQILSQEVRQRLVFVFILFIHFHTCFPL